MSSLKIRVWDVEHGVFISATMPNDKTAIIDCGSSGDLSPASHIKLSDGKMIDYLIISHPHRDHIADILNIDEKFDVDVFARNKSIDKDVMIKDNPDVFEPPNDKYIDKYYEYSEKKFTKDIEKPEDNPQNSAWGSNCTFHNFCNTDKELPVNDMSMATIIGFGDQAVLYGGDLQKQGWEELLKQEDFCKRLSKVTIFIASHHGNESGYCKEIFDYFTPNIIIVSAGKYRDGNTIAKYDQHTDGMNVHKRSDDKDYVHKVLTTRSNGSIDLVIDSAGPKITID